MKSRIEDKNKAIEMRERGCTQPEIVAILGVSKASVSGWVKDVKVPDWYSSHISKIRSDNMILLRETPEWKEKKRIKDQNQRKNPIAIICGIEYFECSKCNQTKQRNQFSKHQKKTCQSWCTECTRNHVKMQYRELRYQVLLHLGGVKCDAGCGCNVQELIEIHHINVNGCIERKEIARSTILNKILKMSTEDARKEYRGLCKVCHTYIHIVLNNPKIKYIIQFKNS